MVCRAMLVDWWWMPSLLPVMLLCWFIYVGHGQYLVYSSKSSILKSVLLFFRFWEYSKCYRFLKSVIFFQAPAQFPKIKMSLILLSITLNFSCSSCAECCRGTSMTWGVEGRRVPAWTQHEHAAFCFFWSRFDTNKAWMPLFNSIRR